jgi:multidrug resistance efflux pump
LAILVLAALAGGGTYGWLHWPAASVQLTLPGIVEVQEVRLSSKIGGRIEQLFVREGDMLQPGQKLVSIEVPELRAQREQVQAQIDAAQADLDKAIAGPRKEEIRAAAATVQLQQAQYDQVVAGNRIEQIEQAQADVEALEADFQTAQQDLNRERSLLAKGASAQATYDAAFGKYGRLQGQLEAAQAKLVLLEKGSRVEEVAQSKAELAKAQANYDLLLAGTRKEDIEAARAAVAQLKGKLQEVDANLAESTVVAPERAVLEVLSVRPGDIVAPNAPVARVLRADDMWVRAYVPEPALGFVRLNEQVAVTIDTYPDKRFTGVVTQIASESEFTPRNIQTIDERHNQVFAIKVRIDDPHGIFKSGMAATVFVAKAGGKHPQ